MSNDFDQDNIKQTRDGEFITNKDRFYNVIYYVPILNIILLFIDDDIKEHSKKYQKQWIALFLIYVPLSILLLIFSIWFSILLTFVYTILIIFLATRAYHDDFVEVAPLDGIADIFMGQVEKNKSKNVNKSNLSDKEKQDIEKEFDDIDKELNPEK